MRKKRPSEYDGAPPYKIGKKWGDKEWKEHYAAQTWTDEYGTVSDPPAGGRRMLDFSLRNTRLARKCPDCGGKFISNTSKFGDKCPKCLQRDEDDMSDAYEARWEDGSGENR